MKKNQKKNLKKNLHLSYKDRCIIQEFLTYGYSFTAIANRIQKDRTTISKEIRNHCFVKPFRGNNEVNCSLLLKPPYVCNGCENSSRCKQPK
ncbi:helix-turn-helix domain-containing protein [Mediterraneibacter gnavus]|uniref:Helix-turn-helix domain-containing protein n=1 Tax=Mediterraneibacter gnavus TaxID=33038 RepID=A0A415RZ55_MEDGN|nr:helix-turn-helix domain-containing protein [Mediterraneibacter gnavus]